MANEVKAAVAIPKRSGNAFRMPVSEVYKVKAVGDVVTGRVVQGQITTGMHVRFDPTGCTGIVASIQMHGQYGTSLRTAHCGDNVGLCIKDLHQLMPQRGDVMVIDDFKNDVTPSKAVEEFTADDSMLLHREEVMPLDDAENDPNYPIKLNCGKIHLGLIVVGQVDAGKSTISGRLLYEMGGISNRDRIKLKEEARELEKQSFLFAFSMDRGIDERTRGMSINISYREFATDSYHFTMIDAPGYRKFRTNMIRAIAQGNVALLVVPADKGGYECSVEKGSHKKGILRGETRVQAKLCYAMGVEQMIVCINKMDHESVNYSEERFNQIKQDVQKILKKIGYKTKKIPFIPISGLHGDNVTSHWSQIMLFLTGYIKNIDKKKFKMVPVEIIELCHSYFDASDNMQWYKGFKIKQKGHKARGYTLLEALKNAATNRKREQIQRAFRMQVAEVYKIEGVRDLLCGRVGQGQIGSGVSIRCVLDVVSTIPLFSWLCPKTRFTRILKGIATLTTGITAIDNTEDSLGTTKRIMRDWGPVQIELIRLTECCFMCIDKELFKVTPKEIIELCVLYLIYQEYPFAHPVPSCKGFEIHSKQRHSMANELTAAVAIPKRSGIAFRMPVSEVYKIKGVGDVVCGRVEQGQITMGMNVKFHPNGCTGIVASIQIHGQYGTSLCTAHCGDNVGLCIKNLPKENMPHRGDVMTIDDARKNPDAPRAAKEFTALVFVQNHPGKLSCGRMERNKRTGEYVVKGGFTPSIHIRTAKAPCQMTAINWKMGKSTSNAKVEGVPYMEAGDQAEVVFAPKMPIIVQPFDECKPLGRFVVMDSNSLIMLGKVTRVVYADK